MKDLTENLKTASEALDHQEAPVEPEADPDAATLVPLADPSVATKP